MATFFLTGKALKAIKNSQSLAPQIIPPFDGWYVDIFNIARKKAVLMTHEGSLLSFVCYLTEVGGGQKIFEWLFGEIESFLDLSCPEHRDRVMDFLLKKSSFHKTRSRKVIGHMTDFKNLIQNSERKESSEGTQGLRKVSAFLHDVPVCINGKEYGRPRTMFMKLLDE